MQELQLVSCCCINRGSVNAHVRVDKDRWAWGSPLGNGTCRFAASCCWFELCSTANRAAAVLSRHQSAYTCCRCQPGEEVTVILDLDNGRSKLPVDGIEVGTA